MGVNKVAFCKTWRGNEFVIPAIKALYPHFDKIVFIHSEFSWCGEPGNNVRKIVYDWAKENDTENKIDNHDYTTKDQRMQYLYGLNYIKNLYNPKYALLFDTDEIWTEPDLNLLFKQAEDFPEFSAYACQMHVYIKDVHYRIYPQSSCQPIVLIRPDRILTTSAIRFTDIPIENKATFNNVFMHHFTYVRKDWEELKLKLKCVYEAEKEAYGHVDFDIWEREKWDKLPAGTDLHTANGWAHDWKGVKVVGNEDLPEVMR